MLRNPVGQYGSAFSLIFAPFQYHRSETALLPVKIFAEGGSRHRLPVVADRLMVDLVEEPVQIQFGSEAIVDIGGAQDIGLVLRGNLRQIQAGEEAAHMGDLTGNGLRHLFLHPLGNSLTMLGHFALIHHLVKVLP